MIQLKMVNGKFYEQIIRFKGIILSFNITPILIVLIKMIIMYYMLIHHLYMRIYLKELL
nr:MAG TPA: hypothetical protein [Caudoviricetes sp.]